MVDVDTHPNKYNIKKTCNSCDKKYSKRLASKFEIFLEFSWPFFIINIQIFFKKNCIVLNLKLEINNLFMLKSFPTANDYILSAICAMQKYMKSLQILIWLKCFFKLSPIYLKCQK